MQKRVMNVKYGRFSRIILILVAVIILSILPVQDVRAVNIPGDVNGDGYLDVRDVVLVIRHSLGLEMLAAERLTRADLNNDGRVNVQDATMMMQAALGLGDGKANSFKLGSEVLLESRRELLLGKRVGLVTNQSGVNSDGKSTIDLFNRASDINLVALYGPEHGIDGKAAAGEYVESYTHPLLGIPVYSLYGATRMPTDEMLKDVDVLVYDIQDIGARTYTYISTLNYCMIAAEKNDVKVVVLDRPNPLGGEIVAGPMMEERFITFVGVDILPMAHGMTVGELALYFNRKIGVDLTVVPMEGYRRAMIFQDTGLDWIQTSPNIPDLDSLFGYMATGLGEGTGVFQADKFKWVGGRGIDEHEYASLMNGAGLPGVRFIPEKRGEAGGVRLDITDFHTFNPARTGIYVLSHAFSLGDFTVPKSNGTIVMFDKVMGTAKIGEYLEEGLTPRLIEERIAPGINAFKIEREKYLLPAYTR